MKMFIFFSAFELNTRKIHDFEIVHLSAKLYYHLSEFSHDLYNSSNRLLYTDKSELLFCSKLNNMNRKSVSFVKTIKDVQKINKHIKL